MKYVPLRLFGCLRLETSTNVLLLAFGTRVRLGDAGFACMATGLDMREGQYKERRWVIRTGHEKITPEDALTSCDEHSEACMSNLLHG